MRASNPREEKVQRIKKTTRMHTVSEGFDRDPADCGGGQFWLEVEVEVEECIASHPCRSNFLAYHLD
jgi:hypothetical protein